MNPSRSRLGALRRLPRDPAEFYAISDMDTARRMGGVLWIFGGLSTLVLMAAWPPTGRIGDGGIAVAVGIVALCLAAAVPLLRWPESVSPDLLVLMSYLAVALLAVQVWVGGEPYAELYILPVVYAAAVHPPRRALAVFGAVALGLAAPLVYDGWSSVQAAEYAAKLLIWFSLGTVTALFAASVKLDRITLRAGQEAATRLARRDPLTGLGNRRAFDEALVRVVAGARHSDRPLSLVISDIEGFKAVNDLHGHMEGDRCLRDVAEALAASVRPGDDCFRWGGDEFAFLLPGADGAQARAVVDRVVRAVRALRPPPGEPPLRLRFGVAEIEPGMDGAALLAAADAALVHAGQPEGSRAG